MTIVNQFAARVRFARISLSTAKILGVIFLDLLVISLLSYGLARINPHHSATALAIWISLALILLADVVDFVLGFWIVITRYTRVEV